MPEAQPVSSPVDTAAHALTRPAAITYAKGTAVIRQLGALIGADAMQRRAARVPHQLCVVDDVAG